MIIVLKVSTTEIYSEEVTHTMSKHLVKCVKCGKQFDANEGGVYYPESHRYACKNCVNKQKAAQSEAAKSRKAEERKAEADEREARTGMRQSIPAMIAKIAAGLVVFASSFSLLSQKEIFSFVVGLVIAFGLIAWGVVPYLKAKQSKRG